MRTADDPHRAPADEAFLAAEVARREQAERERDALRATASLDPVWEFRARDAEAEVARLRQDITALRHAVSADHADDPAWTVTDIATLAQAHRSDSESADAHAPLPDIDDGPDYEAVSRDRQREVETLRQERDELRACLTDAQSLTEQHIAWIESAEASFAALTAVHQAVCRFPALAEFKAIADRLAALRRLAPDLRRVGLAIEEPKPTGHTRQRVLSTVRIVRIETESPIEARHSAPNPADDCSEADRPQSSATVRAPDTSTPGNRPLFDRADDADDADGSSRTNQIAPSRPSRDGWAEV